MIRCARTGPMPGRPSRSATVALLRLTLPGGPAGPAPVGAAPPEAPGTPTATCSPSDTTAARLTDAASVPGSRPPAAAIASATRAPVGRVTSPGERTRPTTDTTTVADVSAASPTDGAGGAEEACPAPAELVGAVVPETGWTRGRSSHVHAPSTNAAIRPATHSDHAPRRPGSR